MKWKTSAYEKLKNLINDSEAQATTEYILLLAIIVGIAISVLKKLIQPALKVLSDSVMNSIENRLSGKTGDGFHRFNFQK